MTCAGCSTITPAPRSRCCRFSQPQRLQAQKPRPLVTATATTLVAARKPAASDYDHVCLMCCQPFNHQGAQLGQAAAIRIECVLGPAAGVEPQLQLRSLHVRDRLQFRRGDE